MQGQIKTARGSKDAAHEDHIATHIIFIIIHRVLYDRMEDGLGIDIVIAITAWLRSVAVNPLWHK